jgi:serpin B
MVKRLRVPKESVKGKTMKQIILIVVVILIVAPIAAACSPAAQPPAGPEPAGEGQIVQVELPRQEAAGVAGDQVAELVAGSNAFAVDLYRAATQDKPGNLIYSPYSISLAFSMVYAGARAETEAQMEETLHYLPQETQHPSFNSLDQYLTSLGQDTEPDEFAGEPFQLNIANAVWGQQGYPFLEDYLAILAQYYGAGLRAVDFTADPEAARQAINEWIEEQTQDRIQDMVPEGVIDALTRLVLVNAIYFKGSWLQPFDEANTQDGLFTLLDGSQVSVPLMLNSSARINFFEGDGYLAALLPYSGFSIDMMVILPDSGQFEAVEAALSADLLARIRQEASEHDVRLVLPKLDFETDLDLKELLMGMGMTAPFEGADFSGIAEGGGLYISDALHKANITVNEVGTEAAAATVIAMRESAVMGAELIIDRPFIFAIQERESGTILFMGRVMNPAE